MAENGTGIAAGTGRSASSRVAGDPPRARIGHNDGPPLDPATSWRRHCWRAARAALAPRLPVEIVRRRVARARELGLAYPAYAAILLGAGRDVIGYLFTAEAVALRVRREAREARVAAEAAAKLAAIAGAERLLLAPVADPEALRAALAAGQGALFDAAGRAPEPGAGPRAGAAAIGALLDPRRLPRDGVVMVGARADERAWAEGARLARFLGADAYFGG